MNIVIYFEAKICFIIDELFFRTKNHSNNDSWKISNNNNLNK